MNIKIVDTTLRDGEQMAGVALGINEKIRIAQLLDQNMGIYQIEAGIPAMGADEKESVSQIVQLGLKSKISAWNRMNIKDIKDSIDCKVDIVHISIPCSDIQIKSKLVKDRKWVMKNIKNCLEYTKGRNFELSVGLEDASRADMNFILEIMEILNSWKVKRVRYADTVGILLRERIFREVKSLREAYKDIEIEIHCHNDFGMAVSNSISAAMGGARYVDCTMNGIGERAGNCDLILFLELAKECFGIFKDINFKNLLNKEKEIMSIISGSKVKLCPTSNILC